MRSRRPLVLVLAFVLAGTAARAAEPIVIRGGTILPISRPPIERGVVVIGADGKIAGAGPAGTVPVPPGAREIDASGKFVMPGVIDTHSHMGVYPWAIARGNADGNEAVAPITPDVRAEDAVYLDDPAFEKARAGGVTTVLVIPGSSNLIGGEGIVLKLRPASTLEGMRFRGAPRQLKMAMGENPKRTYGSRNERPDTRMGNLAVLREAFRAAREYQARWDDYKASFKAGGVPALPRPDFDPKMETLGAVLAGEVRLQVHCYTKSDILALLRLADEFELKIASIHHALEAYKLASELARRGIGVSTWADWWGFKLEAWDGIPENAGICARAGCPVAIHSDSSDGVQRLWHEAAKCVGRGMTEAEALRAITLGPAEILGVAERVGSLEKGKDADIAIFSKHPFAVGTRVDMTIIDGEVVHDRVRADAEERARLERLRAPRPPPEVVAIRGARILPVGRLPIEDGTLVLRDGRIAKVGPAAAVAVPEGARVIEARGLTAIPGMIEGMSRVGLVEVDQDEARHEDDDARISTPHLRVTDGLNPESETVRVARMAGVTTAVIAPAEGALVSGLAAIVDLDGRTVSDMIVRDPFALCVNLGDEPIGRGRGKGEFGSRMGAIAALRDLLVEGKEYARRWERHRQELAVWERKRAEAAAVTVTAAGTSASTSASGEGREASELPPAPPERKLKLEALLPALEGKIPVVFRAHRETDMRAALAIADEFGLKPILNHATEAYRIAPLLAERKVPVVLGPVTTQPSHFETWNATFWNAALLAEAGVPFAIQTGSAHNLRKLPFEAGLATAYGLPEQAALRALTLGAAEALGIAGERGSLEEGKIANVVLLTGSPLEPRSAVKHVFIRGREVPLISRQTELRDRYGK